GLFLPECEQRQVPSRFRLRWLAYFCSAAPTFAKSLSGQRFSTAALRFPPECRLRNRRFRDRDSSFRTATRRCSSRAREPVLVGCWSAAPDELPTTRIAGHPAPDPSPDAA